MYSMYWISSYTVFYNCVKLILYSYILFPEELGLLLPKLFLLQVSKAVSFAYYELMLTNLFIYANMIFIYKALSTCHR